MPAVVPTQAPQAVEISAVFESLYQRAGLVPRVLAGGPPVPSLVLSAYTAVPVLTACGVAGCPNPANLARTLAGALGCLLGSGAGNYLERAKKEAARCAILRLLVDNGSATADELSNLVKGICRRFGVAGEGPSAEAFEDSALGSVYQELLSTMLEGPANDANDLPALQWLKKALNLDHIVVGAAHAQAAQKLIAKGERLEGEAMQRAVDKLLFLSQRAFADDDTEEAELFEMNRLRKVLKITDREARQRIGAVSRALYQQNLSAVKDQVDAQTGEALAGASASFGLPSDTAAQMNQETYRQISTDLLKSGSLAANGKTTLDRAKSVLQLSDRAASVAFESVAGPLLRKDVDVVAEGLREEAPASAEKVKEAASTLAARYEDLGLSLSAAETEVSDGLLAALRRLYDAACKDARINGDAAALKTIDKMLAFGDTAGMVLSELRGAEAAPLTLAADTAAARRLYGLFLERSLDGDAETPEARPIEDVASLLELTAADEEAARIEVCQPRLRKLFTDSIEKSEAMPAAMPMAKAALGATLEAFRLPQEAVEETAMEVYKSRLEPLSNRVIKSHEKSSLDAARSFLSLSESDVRVLHLRAYSRTYEASVEEAMGRGGIMSPEAREALEQLRERLSISSDDAEQILHGVVQARLTNMMEGVRDAFEEATYTKEALTQIWKERGKDVGDDPSADGTGGELGIKDTPTLEGIRGSKLMTELTKVTDFYVGNKVVVERKDLPDEYPVTIGKMIEEKTKEEIYGIFAWNAVTCQDSASRDRWTRAKPHVGGVMGLSTQGMDKVMVRMVSRWANMFIKQKMAEQGKLSEEDIGVLTNWVPTFFGIDKDVTKDMVQGANKGLLVSKALRLLNMPKVTPEDVQKLREEVESWELRLEKDLELTGPQLKSLFRVEVASILEDPELSDDQKHDQVDNSKEGFGLGNQEAIEELQDLLVARCRGCLANAVGDLLQGNETQAVKEMQRLELLAAYAEDTEGVELTADWEVAPSMREQLIKVYAGSASGGRAPNIGLLERALALVPAESG